MEWWLAVETVKIVLRLATRLDDARNVIRIIIVSLQNQKITDLLFCVEIFSNSSSSRSSHARK